uniref:KIB1-4 beta-propeller domain-containing protein n=1 Tax=Arundo donax TaxID=35708 RepID=A0A0A9DAR7_ARUDO
MKADGFQVFKWQTGEGKTGKWARITCLGGYTLFLTHSCFAGCLGPDHRGIRGDCIYFTQETCCQIPRKSSSIKFRGTGLGLSEHVLMHSCEFGAADFLSRGIRS